MNEMLDVAMNANEAPMWEERVRELRRRLESCFALETAAPGTAWEGAPPSSGHCAAVALLVRAAFGGQLQSTTVNGVSHWFNRLRVDQQWLDIDLTGDQFGLEPVQIGDAGSLYPNTRERSDAEVAAETLERALVLARKAELIELERVVRTRLARTTG